MDCFWLATETWMFIVDNRKKLHEMPRSGKIIIKDLLLLDYRVVLEKFNGIDFRIIIWSTLSFFLQACQEGAKTFREEQCLRKQSGSVPYFVSSCMCVTLTVFHLYIMCNSRPYVYEASRKVRWPKIITCNFHLELQLGSWQRVFNYCI